MYVDSWAFCYGDAEAPDRVFLGVIEPGGLFFLSGMLVLNALTVIGVINDFNVFKRALVQIIDFWCSNQQQCVF